MSLPAGNPVLGRRSLLLALAGTTLVVQPADLNPLSDSETRFFAEAAPLFTEWLQTLAEAGAGRTEKQGADAVACTSVAARIRALLAQTAVERLPSTVETFRLHAHAEILPLLARLHEILFLGGYALGAEDQTRFLGMVVLLGEMIYQGEVRFSEDARRRIDREVASFHAQADERFRSVLARILAGGDPDQIDALGHQLTQ